MSNGETARISNSLAESTRRERASSGQGRRLSVEETKHQPPPPVPAEAFKDRLYRILISGLVTSYGISLIIHAILLAATSFIVFKELRREQALVTTVSQSDGDGGVEGMQDILDIGVDLPTGAEGAGLVDSLETAAQLQAVDNGPGNLSNGLEGSLDALFGGSGAGGTGGLLGEGGTGGGGFLNPGGARVFTKGSFSVWTIPNDPQPGEQYEIVIVVKLPPNIKRYRATDLSGIVVGTDRYRQAIPGPDYTRGRVYLPMKDQMAQLSIAVPGGAARVRDRIEIRSTILNEKQTLEIEF